MVAVFQVRASSIRDRTRKKRIGGKGGETETGLKGLVEYITRYSNKDFRTASIHRSLRRPSFYSVNMLSRDQAEQVDVLVRSLFHPPLRVHGLTLPLTAQAGMTLDAMVMDLVTTLSIDAHQEIQRSRSICARCNTRYASTLPLQCETFSFIG